MATSAITHFPAALTPPPWAKALIFDNDGTLSLTRHAHFAALEGAFSVQGLSISEAWYGTKLGLSLNEMCAAWTRDHDWFCDPDIVRREHRARYPLHRDLVRPVEPVVAVARHAFGRQPLAVASGGDHQIVVETLRALDILSLFNVVVAIGHGAEQGKPAPDLFLAAADQLSVSPAECFVYEDSDEGMEAAVRAKMSALDVRQILKTMNG